MNFKQFTGSIIAINFKHLSIINYYYTINENYMPNIELFTFAECNSLNKYILFTLDHKNLSRTIAHFSV